METENTLSLDEPEVVEEATVSLDPAKAILSEKATNNRAAKANFALGDKSPGVDVLVQNLKLGSEDALREQLAQAESLDFHMKKTDLINNLAKKKAETGQPVTEQEAEFFRGMARGDLDEFQHNPETFFEKQYAKKFSEKYGVNYETDPTSVQAKARKEDPVATEKLYSAAKDITARKEIAQTVLEDLNARYEAMGIVDTAITWGEQFIPFKSWYNLSSAVKDAPGSAILPGPNREAQYSYLHSLPPDEFAPALKAAADDIAQSNLLDAQTFVEGALSYSVSDSNIDNLFAVVDIADVATAGLAGAALKGGRGAVKGVGKAINKKVSVEQLKTVLKSTLKANEGPVMDEVRAAAAVGDFDEAATISAVKSLDDMVKGRDPLNEGLDLRNTVPSIFNPKAIAGDPANLVRETSAALVDTLTSSATFLKQAMSSGAAAERLGPEALKAAVKATAASIKERFPNVNKSILDVEHNLAEDSAANVHSVTVYIGDKDKKLFDDYQSAAWYGVQRYGLRLDQFKLKGVGNKVVISVTKNINETENAVRDVLIDVDRKSNDGPMSTLLGRLRSAEDIVSPAQSRNRKIVTHGATDLQDNVRKAAEPLVELSKNKKEYRDLEQVLVANRDKVYDEVKLDAKGNEYKTGKKLRGEFYKTEGDLEKAYLDRHKRLPSAREKAAYFNYVQLMDFDWYMRNLGIYRDHARLGAEEIRVSGFVPTGSGADATKVASEINFKGVIKDDLPWDGPDARIFVQSKADGGGEFFLKSQLTGEQRADIERRLKEGGNKVIQVFNPLDKPLRDTAGTDETIHFMVTDKYSASKLDWNILPYRPGGHVEYKHQWFVKQPKIRRAEGYFSGEARDIDGQVIASNKRHTYEGDISILNVATEAEARKFAEAMDKARVMIKNGDPSADDFIKANLPFTPKEYRLKFEEWIDDAGNRQPPTLHIDDKIHFTSNGRNLSDDLGDTFFKDNYENFENDIRNPYNLFANVDKKFGGTRDSNLDSYKVGKDENAMLTLDEPKLVDPFTTLNHSLGNVMRSRFINDYKIAAVEEWIQEFHDVMKVPGGLEELRRDPVWYLHNPAFDSTTTSRERLVAAQNARLAIVNFLGTQSETGKDIGWLTQKLQNTIYERLGKGASDWVAESELQAIKDPTTFLRGMAFHSKLGFFNPIQLVMQAQSVIHVHAVGGKHSIFSTPAAAMMMRMAHTREPKIIDHMAGMMAKVPGWNKEEFLESYRHLQESGFYHVEGETAWRDDFFDPKVVTSAGGRFLDAGLAPFRLGERFVRLAAWNTAYKEWKFNNPGKQIMNADRNTILQRADLLSVNMTRASSAGWQKGLLSIPTQFLSYNIRLAEQFIGGRLTPQEKLRAFLTYSVFYGVPVAAGAATTLPFYESARQYALEKGINADGFAMKAFLDGLIPASIGLVGENYNISDRFGPGGIKLWKEIIDGDKSVMEVVLGASGGIAGQALVSMYPTLRYLTGMFTDKEDERWPWRAEDALAITGNISTLNNATKMFFALNTGKYITKNEVYMDDVNNWDAVFMGITGLTPQNITDAYLKMDSLKDVSDHQKEVKKLFIAEYRRALNEASKGNSDLADAYMKRAKVYFVGGGWQQPQWASLASEATQGLSSVVQGIEESFVNKSPEADRAAREEQLINKRTK